MNGEQILKSVVVAALGDSRQFINPVLFCLQGSCRVLTHLLKKRAKLTRSKSDQEKQKAILPIISLDEGGRRTALYTGMSLMAS